MSTTPGVFSETTLFNVRDRADRMMLDDRIKQQFIPKINIFNYIRNLQTATLNQKFNQRSGKEYDVEVSWMNACDTFDSDDESCVFKGEEVSTNIETYTLQKRIVKEFYMEDYKFRTNDYESEEAIAKAMLRIDSLISEQFARYLVGRLDTFAGVNAVPSAENREVLGNITRIPPHEWTPELMAYLARVAIMNRFTNPALISGANLWELNFVTNANRVNANGGGDYIMINEFPLWFDLFNVDTVMTPDYVSFMVSQGALAMASKNWNADTPYRSFEDMRYTMPSRFMPGMKYDVYYTNRCFPKEADDVDTSGTGSGYKKDTLAHNWKVVFTGDLFLNPLGCDEDNSGVLKFVNADSIDADDDSE
jgi:hypothetical protein